MAGSNIKLRDRIVSGVLALLIPILGLNIGSSFNSAEAVSYNDESTNNLSVAQHSAENTDNKIMLTLNAITKGKSSNIPVPNTVFKYKVYADIDKKNLISDEKVAYSGSNGQAKIELDDNGTVYVDVWYTRFAAGAVLISIPIAALFMIMQKCYNESMSGAVKG